MCTLALLLRPGMLAITGNRNERLDRPASPPAVRDGVLAPRDEKAQGTWLGLNRHGLFVCITNRAGALNDPARRSRGLLVDDALRAGSARALHAELSRLAADRYNGFHMVYADLQDAFVTVGTGSALQQHELAAGEVHLVTERSYGAGEGERERTVRADLTAVWAPRSLVTSGRLEAQVQVQPQAQGQPQARLQRPDQLHAEDLRAWREPMRVHAMAPLESACVHADQLGYGTRSSLQLCLREGDAAALWTEGHPCTSPARDLSALLLQLRGPLRAEPR